MKLHLVEENNKQRRGTITVTQQEYNKITDLCLLRGRDAITKYNCKLGETITLESFLCKNRVIGLRIIIKSENDFPEVKYYLRDEQKILVESIIKNSHTESPFGYWQTTYMDEHYSVDFKIIEDSING